MLELNMWDNLFFRVCVCFFLYLREDRVAASLVSMLRIASLALIRLCKFSVDGWLTAKKAIGFVMSPHLS